MLSIIYYAILISYYEGKIRKMAKGLHKEYTYFPAAFFDILHKSHCDFHLQDIQICCSKLSILQVSH
jgi:hypothetical protein